MKCNQCRDTSARIYWPIIMAFGKQKHYTHDSKAYSMRDFSKKIKSYVVKHHNEYDSNEVICMNMIIYGFCGDYDLYGSDYWYGGGCHRCDVTYIYRIGLLNQNVTTTPYLSHPVCENHLCPQCKFYVKSRYKALCGQCRRGLRPVIINGVVSRYKPSMFIWMFLRREILEPGVVAIIYTYII